MTPEPLIIQEQEHIAISSLAPQMKLPSILIYSLHLFMTLRLQAKSNLIRCNLHVLFINLSLTITVYCIYKLDSC